MTIVNGIARDLNDLLTVINGYSELLRDCLDPADPNRRLVEEVLCAGARAAVLTCQLQLPSRHRGVAMTAVPPAPRQHVTVLLVEDEDAVRGLLCHLLRSEGYRVLDAPGGPEALALCGEEPEPIDLLITDVTMPVIGGLQLAETLCQRYADLHVLFVSGYTDDAIALPGIAPERVTFVPKPFIPSALMRRVRELLDAARQ